MYWLPFFVCIGIFIYFYMRASFFWITPTCFIRSQVPKHRPAVAQDLSQISPRCSESRFQQDIQDQCPKASTRLGMFPGYVVVLIQSSHAFLVKPLAALGSKSIHRCFPDFSHSWGSFLTPYHCPVSHRIWLRSQAMYAPCFIPVSHRR